MKNLSRETQNIINLIKNPSLLAGDVMTKEYWGRVDARVVAIARYEAVTCGVDADYYTTEDIKNFVKSAFEECVACHRSPEYVVNDFLRRIAPDMPKQPEPVLQAMMNTLLMVQVTEKNFKTDERVFVNGFTKDFDYDFAKERKQYVKRYT